MKKNILSIFVLLLINGVIAPQAQAEVRTQAGDAGDFFKIINALVGSRSHDRDYDRGYDRDYSRGSDRDYDHGRESGRGDRSVIGRGYTCVATDKGTEEHRRGHNGCDECLIKHGKCIETCSEQYYVCIVTGTDRDGYSSDLRPVMGESLWRTQDRALRLCERSGYDNCVLKRCDSEREIISRRRC